MFRAQINTQGLNDALYRYMRATKKAWPDVVNRQMKNILIKSKDKIPYSSREKIEADLKGLPMKILVRYSLAAMAKGKLKVPGIGAKRAAKMSSKEKVGRVLSSREAMSKLIKAFINMKKSHAGYVYRGWINAFKTFGVGYKKRGVGGKTVSGSAAFKAQESDDKTAAIAINNANSLRFSSRTNAYQQNIRAIEDGISEAMDDMKRYVQETLKKHW